MEYGTCWLDLKSNSRVTRYWDRDKYAYYVSGENGDKETGHVVLSEREETDKIRREKARKRGDKYYITAVQNVHKPENTSLDKYRSIYKFLTVKETNTDKLYGVYSVRRWTKEGLEFDYYMIPMISTGRKGHPLVEYYPEYTAEKKISLTEFNQYFYLPVLCNERDHGNNDMSFMDNKKKKGLFGRK